MVKWKIKENNLKIPFDLKKYIHNNLNSFLNKKRC